MASNDVKITITAQDRTKRAFASVNRGLAGVTRAAFSAKTALAGVGSGFAIKGIVNAASEVEQLKIRMKFLTGSVEDGARAFQIMDGYASQVPFTLQDIQKATPALLAVAGDVEQLNGLLSVTGDISVASGISFQDTALQLQRSLSSGIASAEIFRERAVRSMLGFQEGVEYNAKQTRQHIHDAFNGSALDIKGATKAMAATYAGNVSMMEDAWFKFKLALAETGVFESIGKAIIWITGKFKLFAAMVKDPRLHEMLGVIPEVFDKARDMVFQMGIGMLEFFVSVAKGFAWLDKSATDFLQSINNNLAKLNPTIQSFVPITEDWLSDAKAGVISFTTPLNAGLDDAIGKTKELNNIGFKSNFDITKPKIKPIVNLTSFDAQMDAMSEKLTDIDTQAVGFVDRFSTGLSTQLTQALITGQASFRDFALSIISDLTSMIIKAMLFRSIKSALKGTTLGGLINGASGGAVTSVEHKASGGSLNKGKPFIVGEQGREIFVPKSDGHLVPNHQIGGGNLNVTFNLNAIDTQTGTGFLMENKQAIIGMVDQAYRRQGRQGVMA